MIETLLAQEAINNTNSQVVVEDIEVKDLALQELEGLVSIQFESTSKTSNYELDGVFVLPDASQMTIITPDGERTEFIQVGNEQCSKVQYESWECSFIGETLKDFYFSP